MVKLYTLLVLVFLIMSCGLLSQTDTDEKRLDKICDIFMQDFSKGQFKEAIQLLKENSVIEAEKLDTLQVTIENQSQNVFPAYGKMLSVEFITAHKVKDFIEKRFYILKFEKYPLKVDFTLYKSSNGWTITSFHYNEDLIELLY